MGMRTGLSGGKTSAGIPVYNVAVHVFSRHLPGQAALRIVEV